MNALEFLRALDDDVFLGYGVFFFYLLFICLVGSVIRAVGCVTGKECRCAKRDKERQ